MFAALSIGILTALTGTGISQVAPAFADKEECEDNDDNNCNERTHTIKQDDDCKAVNEYEKIGSMDSTTNNNEFICTNILTSPANGDDNVLDVDGVSNEPGDVLICHRPSGNPTQSQTLSLSQNAADSHIANHPFDTTGSCPT
jgi:hypothetical protein